MKWQPAPIIGGAYADNARPFSHQDTVNWLPVRTERPGGRSDWKLTPAPGLKAFSTLTNASTDSSDRIRGVRNVEGRLYVVCGQSLFRINGNGTATTIQENAIPGTQRVSMTHNQETGGNTLVMTNGYGGWTYNTGTATFAEITDEGFPGFKVCDFLDQYIVGIDPTGRFAFHSELANAGSYNTLDRYEAEAAPDRLVGQVVDHGQWWLFGERTTEIYTNTGAATGTFQRIPGSTIERGLAGTFAVAKLDNSVFWVGDDGVVYRANGYTPVRISTHPIEQELSQCDLSLAFCMVYEDRGHKILYVTCPDGKTWGYDVATQEWHRRQSYARENWRMESLVRWSGGWFGGDKLTNKLQRVDWGYQDEDGQPLIAERITGILHGNQNRVQVHGIELVLDSGRVPGPVRPPAEIVYPVEIYNPLTAAYVRVAVSHSYLGRYGVEPYTFSLDAGTLPAGLSLASTGALTGTPTTAASYAWRVKITDAIGQTDTLDQGVDLAEGIDAGAPFEVVDWPGFWDSTPSEFSAGGVYAFEENDRAIYAEYSGGINGLIRAQSVQPLTGKRYFEFDLAMNDNTAAGRFYVGFHNDAQTTWPAAPSGNSLTLDPQDPSGAATVSYPIGRTFNTPVLPWSSTSFGTVRVRAAVDVATRTCWFGDNSGWFNSGDPAAGTGGWQLQNTGNPVYLYGDLDNITAAKQRRIEIVLPTDFTWTVPTGFNA